MYTDLSTLFGVFTYKEKYRYDYMCQYLTIYICKKSTDWNHMQCGTYRSMQLSIVYIIVIPENIQNLPGSPRVTWLFKPLPPLSTLKPYNFQNH